MKYLKNCLFGAFLLAASFQITFSQKTNFISPLKANSVADGYNLVWHDEFNGTTLDETNNWVAEIDGGGGGNAELEYYRRENISVGVEPITGANCLIITGKKESFSGKTCTSGRLKTSGLMSFKHGKIEARIKLPHTANGLWPAFWMMGQDYPLVGWPKCGEIDIMEMGNSNGIKNGTQDKYFGSHFHWGESWNGGSYPNYGTSYTSPTGIQDDFVLFTLIWDDSNLKTYYGTDANPMMVNVTTMSITGTDVAPNATHYFHKQFYVIFNLAIGGNYTGITNINNITALNASNNYEAKMYVDYVRVYQQGVAGEEYSGPALAPTALNDVSTQNTFKLYPNPTKNQINIASDSEISKVTVITMSGQEMMSVSNSKTINTSTLSSGNYLIKIVDVNGKAETHQITKQ
jgi:beta-glucanase (GH16 family)